MVFKKTKTNFNIVLNSTLTSSFTGNISNANYYVNLSSLIDDEIEDYKKKYKITFRLKTASSTNILSSQSYLCELYINSRVYNQENLLTNYTLGVLSKSLDDSTNNYYAFDTFPNDNPPLVIQNLDRSNSLNIQFHILETGAFFTNMPNYILILNFEEID
jgi:hypothetical protein